MFDQLRTVPALIATAFICIGLSLTAGLCSMAYNGSRLPGRGYLALVLFGVGSGAAAIALFITSASLQTMHWNDSCHRLGGVLGEGSDECLKPGSTIDVP